MVKYKTKAIHADLDIFTDIPAYSDIPRYIQPGIASHNQAYSGIIKPCVTLTYSEPWYIQDPEIIRTLVYSAKRWQI